MSTVKILDLPEVIEGTGLNTALALAAESKVSSIIYKLINAQVTSASQAQPSSSKSLMCGQVVHHNAQWM